MPQSGQVKKDLSKVKFNVNKNLNINPLIQNIDGLVFIWCSAGDDNEIPVHFIIYVDWYDKIRAYIPSDGNSYDKKHKCAYKKTDNEEEIIPCCFQIMLDNILKRIEASESPR